MRADSLSRARFHFLMGVRAREIMLLECLPSRRGRGEERDMDTQTHAV